MRVSSPGIALAMLLLGGCAGLPRNVQKLPSQAFAHAGDTHLGRIVAAAHGAPQASGIRLLASGDEALASLIALADRAEHTLDIQYYIIHQDGSARLLLHHLDMAAERGVRVRVLVDDLNTAGEDRRFLRLGQRAHVEVRVFNPFPGGRFSTWSRFVASASDIPRINHRMHNKLFVADNSVAVTGGRNIGDQYFTRDLRNNFIDLDVVAVGAVVPQLSATFDAFWNSKYAYPIASVAAAPGAVEEAAGAAVGEAPGDAAVLAGTEEANWLGRELDANALWLTWVRATVLADTPGKIAGEAGIGARAEAAADGDFDIARNIKSLLRAAREEVIIISPYFVPGPDGVALMRELTARGVHIRILTNSLASTDSPLVHNGYSRYRVELLKLGVELAEVRPKLGQRRPRFHPFKSSMASLHAKALVIDQRIVFVGSMNMDARSARTNSEMGLVIRSPEIAAQVTGLLDDLSSEGSYRLSLDPRGQLEWSSDKDGAPQRWYNDPETTRWQRFLLEALAPFAPEELL